MSYEIEKGIPVPHAVRGEIGDLADKMEEGDSVVIPKTQGATLRRYIMKLGYHSTCSRTDDDNVRVWKGAKKI